MKKIILASLLIGISFAVQAQSSAKKTTAQSAGHTGQVLTPQPLPLPVPFPAMPPKATPTPPKAPPKVTPTLPKPKK